MDYNVSVWINEDIGSETKFWLIQAMKPFLQKTKYSVKDWVELILKIWHLHLISNCYNYLEWGQQHFLERKIDCYFFNSAFKKSTVLSLKLIIWEMFLGWIKEEDFRKG